MARHAGAAPYSSPSQWPKAMEYAFRSRRKINGLSVDERQKIIKRLQFISKMFDDAVTVPGTKITLGYDAILGLIPVVGDTITTGVSAYFIWEAHRLGLSRWTMFRMAWNVLIDFVVGFIPLLGDFFDVAFRANRKNLNLLLKEMERQYKDKAATTEAK